MIRIATIGTSAITVSFIDALARVEGAAFVGTLSRSAERSGAFTVEHGGTTPFTSLDDLAASAEVDAVYIASPNALHHTQALACIAGGKHVLVEKPFCANEREAREVFDAARAAGVVALEAMRPLHDPAFQALKELIGRLGTMRRATLRFGKYSSRYNEILAGRQTNAFDCSMASGSLMDIGVYTVEPLIELFGAPARVHAAAALLDEDTRELTGGVLDGAGVILASYPHMVATLQHSKITNDLTPSQIEGEAGTLTIDAIATPSHARLEMRDTGSTTDTVGYSSAQTVASEIDLPAAKNSMQHELADFIAAIQGVHAGSSCVDAVCGPFGTVAHFREMTLASLALMDEARRQAGVIFPADAPRDARGNEGYARVDGMLSEQCSLPSCPKEA